MNTALPEGDFPEDPASGADRYVADSRGDEAVEARRRERWSRQLRAEATTLNVALDAAIGVPVVLVLSTGERAPVVISDLGADHVEVRMQACTRWIPLRVIVALESERAFVVDAEELTEPTTLLVDVLESLAADDRRVAVALPGGTVVRGDLVAVGSAVTLRILATGHHMIIATDSIDSVTLLD